MLRLDPSTGSLIERRWEVRVLSGAAKGESVVLGGPLVVGSGRAAGLRLNDETVSRKHAQLTVTRDAVHVVDLGSTNGVFLGSARVPEATIDEEAVVSIGTCRLRIAPVDHDLGKPEAAAGFGGLVGQSPAMLRLFGVLTRVAPTESVVLLRGETGTGKDEVARAIHRCSHRSKGPFVVVDCAALTSTLAETELFGHATGAFTGAGNARPGALERANGGTLFLDEVGELPLPLQPLLLRFLESSEVQRVGDAQRRQLDVRVLAATHAPLRAPAFREDLYFRLAVLEVVLPPLRDRSGDVRRLALAFARAQEVKRELPEPFLASLEARPWPGNVRELRNAVERALALFPNDSALELATVDATTGEVFSRPVIHKDAGADEQRTQVVRALERCGGNQKLAAQMLGIARGTLITRMERLGIRRPRKA